MQAGRTPDPPPGGVGEYAASTVAEEPREKSGAQKTWREWLYTHSPELKVGTLKYTGMGMLVMYLWLFWGDMVFTLTEAVFPASIGLQLDRLGVPKEWVGFLKGTAGAAVTLVLVPVIGFKSDRTRTRWGRRIPYIMWTIVPVSLTLAALGFTDDIGDWIRAHPEWPARFGMSPTTMILWVVGSLVVLFDVANVFVMTVWWFLLRDVVPNTYITRFYAAFGLVATVNNILFNTQFAWRVETHTRELYCGSAILYFVGFAIICLTVKEGQYPLVERLVHRESWMVRLGAATKLYFKECFSHPMILMLYVGAAIGALTLACATYSQLYYLRYLGFSLKDQAWYWSWQGVAILIIKYPIGWSIEKLFHPMRAYFYSGLLLLPLPWLYFMVDDYHIAGYLLPAYWMWVLNNMWQCPLTQYNYLSQYPLQTKLYPADKFGQFMSANTMVTAFISIFAMSIGSAFIGWGNRKFGQYGNGLNFLWQGIFSLVGFVFMCVTYRYWKLFCGANFNPELVTEKASGISRAALWRPVWIGVSAAVCILGLGVWGAVIMSNRPSFGYDVNAEKELEYARTIPELHELLQKERAGFEKRHAENLVILAKKHWFYERDAATEMENYQQALRDLEGFKCWKTYDLEASGRAKNGTTAPANGKSR